MVAPKSYRQLGAPQLCEFFTALNPGAFTIKGRDAHLMSRFLKETGALPTQVLEGMVYRGYPAVAIFLSESDSWLLRDTLAQEANLAVWLHGTDDPPACYFSYSDLSDSGIPSAQIDAAWEAAKRELQTYVDATLDAKALSPHHPRIRAAIERRSERLAV